MNSNLRTLVYICTLLLAVHVHSQQTDCQKFIDHLLDQIMTQNLTRSSIPTIIYSGITPNNPGQMKQCKDSNYSYYLIYARNQTNVTENFTGACVPHVCSPEDIQKALTDLSITAKVYDYPANHQWNNLTIIGLVVILLWLSALIVWSTVVSIKDSQVKQSNKKDQGERNSINNELAQPLIQQVGSVNQEYKIFIFYEGYKQLFESPKKKSIFSPIMFFAVLSYLLSVQFSYRLSISANKNTTAPNFLNSIIGVLVGNTEIALHTIMFILGLRLAYGMYKLNTFKEMFRFYFDQVLKKWVLLLLMTLLAYTYVTMFTSEPLNKLWDINNGQECQSSMWQIWLLFKNMQTNCTACLPWMSLVASQIFFILISAPFLLIFRTFRKLGYGLFSLVILNSIFVSYAILDSQGVVFQPGKLMTGQRKYVLDYQANTFVRMGAYFFGLMFGLFIIQGLEKTQSQTATNESKLAKYVRRNNPSQIIFQFVGLALMITTFLLIIPYLNPEQPNQTPYWYLILAPLGFIIGLSVFMIPSFWEGQGVVTKLVNNIFGWKKWVHLDRVSMTFYMIGPMVMAWTTYGMQSSIYFDLPTTFTYALGDLVLSYLFTILIASSFEYQLNTLSGWLQYKIYGNQTKYSVLVIQEE